MGRLWELVSGSDSMVGQFLLALMGEDCGVCVSLQGDGAYEHP